MEINNTDIKTKENFEIRISETSSQCFHEVRRVGASKYAAFPGFYISPTHNCQLISIASASSLVEYDENYIEYFFKEMYSRTSKRVLLLDVREDEWDYAWEAFKKYCRIINSMEYISTNDSEMMIVILKLDVVKLGFDDPEDYDEENDDW